MGQLVLLNILNGLKLEIMKSKKEMVCVPIKKIFGPKDCK